MSKGGGQQQQGGGGGGGGGDNSMDFLWIMAGIIIAGGFTWYFLRAPIVWFVFKLRLYEIEAITFVLDAVKIVTQKIPHFPAIDLSLLQQWKQYIATHWSMTDDVAFQTVQNLSEVVGRFLRYPVAAILGVLGIFLYLSHVTERFKVVYDMRSFRKAEQMNWPQILPISKLNLIEEPLDKLPWAMSQQPMAFVKAHGLGKEDKKDGRPIMSVIKGLAHQQFAMQLGPYWTGLEALPPHTQALFAIFAAKANRDGDGAMALLAQISTSARNTGKLNFSGVRALLVKHVRIRKVGRVVGMHAYVYTIMASMLELARTDGVLAASEFLWLKAVDRKLWHMLTMVGRQTAFPEIAGAFAHWIIEKRLRRPLKVPMVSEAVKALEAAMDDMLYNPDTM